MDDRDEVIARLNARVKELETAIRILRTGLANMLTILKEYGGSFLKTYQASMAQADAEEATLDLGKKFNFKDLGDGKENVN